MASTLSFGELSEKAATRLPEAGTSESNTYFSSALTCCLRRSDSLSRDVLPRVGVECEQVTVLVHAPREGGSFGVRLRRTDGTERLERQEDVRVDQEGEPAPRTHAYTLADRPVSING